MCVCVLGYSNFSVIRNNTTFSSICFLPENTLFSQHWLELICKTSPGVYCLGEDFYLFTLFTIIYILLFTIFTVAS